MYFRRNFLRIRKKKKVKHIPLDNVFYDNNVFLFNSLETTSSDYRRLNFILLFIITLRHAGVHVQLVNALVFEVVQDLVVDLRG